MRTSLKRILLLACTAVMLCSCADFSKIVFSDFQVSSIDSLKYSLTDMSAIANTSLKVDNPYFAMTLKNFEAEVITPDGDALGNVWMDENVLLEVAAKDQTLLEAPLRVHVKNPIKLLAMGSDALGTMLEGGYLLNYSVEVSKGGRFHKIVQKNVPLESFIKPEE
ncbi:MAG: hypothetical protein IKX60_08560 [Bacteroidales bacterium]|nr:hypothetical protein [Bacteroidales bacterium]